MGCVMGVGVWCVVCVAQASSESAAEEETPSLDGPSLYEMPVKELSPVECGRCHTTFYELIKTEGGGHRIDCRRCHVEFHVYRPGMDYEEVLPKCDACHDEVHGPDLTRCSGCHSEAHAPMRIPAGVELEKGCYICHPEIDKEIKTYVNFHTDFYCSSCHHTRHRYVPECLECHQPHTKEMTEATCLPCHPAHKALQVVYPEDTPDETCAICHRRAHEVLGKSGTKHAALRCIKCHPEKHRAMLRCTECHDAPHSDAMLDEFPVCGRCHGTAHSLSRG